MSKHPELSFAACLRHAFFTGAGYGDLEKISDADLARWVTFEPPETGCFASMKEHFAEHHKDIVRLEEDSAVMEQATAKIEEQRETIRRYREALTEIRDIKIEPSDDEADLLFTVQGIALGALSA